MAFLSSSYCCNRFPKLCSKLQLITPGFHLVTAHMEKEGVLYFWEYIGSIVAEYLCYWREKGREMRFLDGGNILVGTAEGKGVARKSPALQDSSWEGL